jgi:hypothetical protein
MLAGIFSAGDALLSQEVADSKINVQSACALNTVYFHSQKGNICPVQSWHEVVRAQCHAKVCLNIDYTIQ